MVRLGYSRQEIGIELGPAPYTVTLSSLISLETNISISVTPYRWGYLHRALASRTPKSQENRTAKLLSRPKGSLVGAVEEGTVTLD